jgi:ERCC4-type nuclease
VIALSINFIPLLMGLGMISIFVDYRERNHEIVSFLRKCAGVTVQFAKLEVGDYLLHNLLVERKTLVDFCESIKSGRIFS